MQGAHLPGSTLVPAAIFMYYRYCRQGYFEAYSREADARRPWFAASTRMVKASIAYLVVALSTLVASHYELL